MSTSGGKSGKGGHFGVNYGGGKVDKSGGDSADENASKDSSTNGVGGDENIVVLDDDLEGFVVQVQRFDSNLFHTDLVTVSWESMHVIPNRIRELY